MQSQYLLIAIAVAIPILFFMFTATKFCSKLMWFILFCYPHALTVGILPLNMGMDDLYIIALAIAVFFNGLSKGDLTFGFAAKAALLFWLVDSLSQITGALTGPPQITEHAIKAVLKGGIYFLGAFAIENSINSEQDINKILKWFLIAGFCGAITIIGQVIYEPAFRIFTWYRPEEWNLQNIRGGGAFLDPNAGGVMMLILFLLCFSKLKNKLYLAQKNFYVILCFFFLVTLMLTRSRSTMVGLVFSVFAMVIFSNMRKYIFVVIIIGSIVILLSDFILNIITSRWSDAGSSAQDRFHIWWTIMSNPSPFIFLAGRGAAAEYTRLNVTPHNTYIHIIFELGFLGTSWVIWFCYKLFKYAKKPLSEGIYIGNWIIFTLIALAGSGLTIELLFISQVKYTLFFMAAIIYKVKILTENEFYNRSFYFQNNIEDNHYD